MLLCFSVLKEEILESLACLLINLMTFSCLIFVQIMIYFSVVDIIHNHRAENLESI